MFEVLQWIQNILEVSVVQQSLLDSVICASMALHVIVLVFGWIIETTAIDYDNFSTIGQLRVVPSETSYKDILEHLISQ